MQGRVITISRQCGSGGHSIGSELARHLSYVDRKDVLNISIHAEMEYKKKHCMKRQQFPEENAEDMIRRRDKLRPAT